MLRGMRLCFYTSFRTSNQSVFFMGMKKAAIFNSIHTAKKDATIYQLLHPFYSYIMKHLYLLDRSNRCNLCKNSMRIC